MAPLHDAAKSGDMGALNACVEDQEADLDVQDANGWTALHHIAKTGEAAAGAMLVENEARTDIGDNDGNTALHVSAINNTRLVTSMLLWGGADVCAKNKKGNTPLHEAAAHDAKDVAFLLIENGQVDTRDVKNTDGKIPMDIATEAGHARVKEVIATGVYGD
eukprot:TRINITY_DN59965_c0_g1_i1.p2 TRINITY_DN59965_c0_g1~~TRINITY_DN59965_c0_g1_i1.p2  ORF type:complete len:188 (+),score=37.36 TRINITY_DN59965_c0_g1_i1:81-566(+)